MLGFRGANRLPAKLCRSDSFQGPFMPEAISIRPLRETDVDPLHEAVRESMAELLPWMPWCRPEYARAETEARIANRVATWEAKAEFSFVIESETGTILGCCGLNRIEHDCGTANLGYWVRSSATSRGIATRAVAILRDWAFANTELHRLEIMAAVGNVGSLRVAAKAGAVREGVLRQRLVVRGVRHDAVLYSILRT